MITETQVQRELQKVTEGYKHWWVHSNTIIVVAALLDRTRGASPTRDVDVFVLLSPKCFRPHANNIHDAGSRNCAFSVFTQSIKLSTRPLSYNNVGERNYDAVVFGRTEPFPSEKEVSSANKKKTLHLLFDAATKMCIFVTSLHLLAKLNSKPYGNKRNGMRIATLVSVKLGKSRPDVYFSSISQTCEYLTR